jgi:AmiR/NasT family two-component response regulator
MKSRAVIEQAKGVLIERYRLTEDQAFAVLIRSSQTNNVKVRDIADHLVSTGELLGQTEHAHR